MKKVFFGLAVAVVALSASAFTNANSNKLVPAAYIVDFDAVNQEYIFELADPGAITCPNTSLTLPCGITPLTYSLPTGTDRLPKAVVDSRGTDTQWDSTRSSF